MARRSGGGPIGARDACQPPVDRGKLGADPQTAGLLAALCAPTQLVPCLGRTAYAYVDSQVKIEKVSMHVTLVVCHVQLLKLTGTRLPPFVDR